MLGRYKENEDDNVRPFVEITSNRSESFKADMSEIDWLGNTTLHHCFANNEVIMPSVNKVLNKFPEYALVKNQFGRIPLHYALDRIKVNVEGVKKLIEIYPQGVYQKDNESKTPYDVAVKWKHSREIKKLLLDVEPNLDRATYFRIRYGFLAVIYNLLFNVNNEPKRTRVYTSFFSSGDRGEEDGSMSPHDAGNRRRDGATDDDTPPPGEYDINTSAVAVVDQTDQLTSSALGTSRGDISEQNSFGQIVGGNSKLTLSTREGRRSSLQELTEEPPETAS